MCLSKPSHKSLPLVAEEDIPVYKLVRSRMWLPLPIAKFFFKLGFKTLTSPYYLYNWGPGVHQVDDKEWQLSVASYWYVNDGFHCVKKDHKYHLLTSENTIKIKCFIPKGTEYYIDSVDDHVMCSKKLYVPGFFK